MPQDKTLAKILSPEALQDVLQLKARYDAQVKNGITKAYAEDAMTELTGILARDFDRADGREDAHISKKLLAQKLQTLDADHHQDALTTIVFSALVHVWQMNSVKGDPDSLTTKALTDAAIPMADMLFDKCNTQHLDHVTQDEIRAMTTQTARKPRQK